VRAQVSWRGRTEYDRLRSGVRSDDVCTMVLITGPIWRVDMGSVVPGSAAHVTVILWNIFAAYLVLRAVGRDDPQIARYGAVLSIVGVLDVPLIMCPCASACIHPW